MSNIDWPRLLQAQGIEFIEAGGKSTSKNNIYVRCPLCGANDKGYHMGISLKGKGWACWKSSLHRGKSPIRLLTILLNISHGQAAALLQEELGVDIPDDAAIGDRLKLMLGEKPLTTKHNRTLKLDKTLGPIKGVNGHRMFTEYLQERDYTEPQIHEVCKQYNLQCALDGAFRYRIIFPIFNIQGLVTWTGRTIQPDREPRYLTLPSEEEAAERLGCKPALLNIKDCLLDEDKLLRHKGSLLIVCEGPFDAMRLGYAATGKNAYVTCLFGKAISPTQEATLETLSMRYKRRVILLDPDAKLDTFAMWDKLAPLGFKMAHIPKGWEDPGAMPLDKASDFIEGLLRGEY